MPVQAGGFCPAKPPERRTTNPHAVQDLATEMLEIWPKFDEAAAIGYRLRLRFTPECANFGRYSIKLG